jgi:hypothetical protein
MAKDVQGLLLLWGNPPLGQYQDGQTTTLLLRSHRSTPSPRPIVTILILVVVVAAAKTASASATSRSGRP